MRGEPLPKPLIPEARIRARVDALAAAVSKDYASADELLLVGILRGAFIFLADLSRRLTVPRRVDFVSVASYGHTTRSTGVVEMLMDLREEIRGRHVLVVEDIIDTGHTLRFVMDAFAAREPASLRSCVLVSKPARRQVSVRVDYLGFEIPDVWAVGYGLDYADRHRALPYIGVVEPSEPDQEPP